MTGRRAVAVAMLIALAMTDVSVQSVSAQTEGSGELDGGTLGVGIETARRSPAVPIDSGSPSLPRLVHYEWIVIPAVEAGDLAGLCNANTQTPSDPQQAILGWFYRVIGRTRDNRVVSDELICVAPPNPNAVQPPEPPTPVSPTIGKVWRAVGLPRPLVGVNPVSRGVTGLTTQLWSGGAQTVQVATTIGAYRITGTARVVEYRFSTDEGYLGAVDAPGDAASPAATHMFVTKGAHSLSVASVWQATVTMVGPGVAVPIPLDIDTAVLTATVVYPVVEVRSRLVA